MNGDAELCTTAPTTPSFAKIATVTSEGMYYLGVCWLLGLVSHVGGAMRVRCWQRWLAALGFAKVAGCCVLLLLSWINVTETSHQIRLVTHAVVPIENALCWF